MKFKDEGYTDLDKEVVIRKDGRRLTEADVEELAREAPARIEKRAGRPSLSGLSEKSPAIAVRLPAATRQKLKDRAEREGKSLSQLAREALESYVSYPQTMTRVTPQARRLRAAVSANAAGMRDVMDSYGATNAKVFGSVARGDASDTSDVDVMVDLTPGLGNDLLRVSGIAEELSALLGVRVDVVSAGLLRDEVSTTALRDAVPV